MMADARRMIFAGTAAALGLGAASNAYASSTPPSVNITQVPDIGTVVSGTSGNTVFTIDPSSGGVTVASGSGGRPTLSTNGAAYGVVSVTCGNYCNGNSDLHVQIRSTGFNVNRGRGLGQFTVQMVTGVLDTGVSGASTGPDDTYDLYIRSPGNATFKFGGQFTIAGADSGSSTGLAESSFQINAIAGGNIVSEGLLAKATVGRGLQVSVSGSLNFGTIVRPATNGVVAISADDGQYYNSNVITLKTTGAPSRPIFTIVGVPSATVSITVPPQMTLTNATNNTLTVATSNNAGSSRNLDSTGTFTFGVGGSIYLTSATPSGVYTGSLTVSVNYN